MKTINKLAATLAGAALALTMTACSPAAEPTPDAADPFLDAESAANMTAKIAGFEHAECYEADAFGDVLACLDGADAVAATPPYAADPTTLDGAEYGERHTAAYFCAVLEARAHRVGVIPAHSLICTPDYDSTENMKRILKGEK